MGRVSAAPTTVSGVPARSTFQRGVHLDVTVGVAISTVVAYDCRVIEEGVVLIGFGLLAIASLFWPR